MTPRCNWCGQFVPTSMPAFTWHRDWGIRDWVNGQWVQHGPDLGWTDPQRLCPDDAFAASREFFGDIFAEVDPA